MREAATVTGSDPRKNEAIGIRAQDDAGAQRAYDEILRAALPEELTSHLSTQGAIKSIYKIMCGHKHLYTAIPNKKWVLWYFRSPALKRGFIGLEATREKFPTCNMTRQGDLRLRILSPDDAREVLAWIGAEH